MGLLFNANGEKCVFNQAAFDNMSTITIAMWVKLNTVDATARTIFTKRISGAGWEYNVDNISGWVWVREATGGLQAAITNADVPPAGVWFFIAAPSPVVGSRPNFYEGSLTAIVADITTDNLPGSGSFDDDRANDASFAGRANDSGDPDVHIGWVGVWDTVLTLDELKRIQYAPMRNAGLVQPSNLLLSTIPGYHGITTSVDLSGKGNDGVITNATLSDHVPLGPPFGFDRINSFTIGSPMLLRGNLINSPLLSGRLIA